MNQQSTCYLPTLPEDTVEGQYAEGSEEEDQTVQIQSLIKQMKDLLLTQMKKKGKRRPEYSPKSPTPGPRGTSTPKTEQRLQIIPKKVFLSTPKYPSPLQKETPKVTFPIFRIRAKDYNLVFDGNEVEKFIKRVETEAEIEGASGEDIARQLLFMSASEELEGKIEAMEGYEAKNLKNLKEALTTEWGRVEPDRRYRPEYWDNLFNNIKSVSL
ncbi:hypothetical protein O181_127598 [Austropuccinia psidii MF-1]|uniref:Uncharacterized protein n=1 Tax=Austropuccinia psidii MF-1 TaxID=1389203 RepID=A0A9Q3Q740_9BASI|nr:hypothetical protein [Austropuccinia psidii MF-1]